MRQTRRQKKLPARVAEGNHLRIPIDTATLSAGHRSERRRCGVNTMTIEELLEKEAIKELRILYSHYFDGKDLDGLVSLFTEDAVCEFGPEYGGDWVGKTQIRENYARFTGGEGPEFGVLHAVTNPWIRLVDESTAHGRWYLMDLRTTEGVENPLILFGIYDDLYRKIDGSWRIHRTRIDFLWPKRHYHGPRQI